MIGPVVHDLPAGSLANVDGDGTYVRVQVLTNAGALDRGKQLAVVRQLTHVVAAAARAQIADLAKNPPGSNCSRGRQRAAPDRSERQR